MILSFIVPCYNVELYVEKCIDSLENQDIPKDDYEILAYDDESKDNTLCVLEKLAKKYPNVKVSSHKNKGLSGTRNRGIREAQGDFIWFIDSDDWITEKCLGNILSSITDETDIVAFSGFIPEGNRSVGADIFGEKSQISKPYSLMDLLMVLLSICIEEIFLLRIISFLKKASNMRIRFSLLLS